MYCICVTAAAASAAGEALTIQAAVEEWRRVHSHRDSQRWGTLLTGVGLQCCRIPQGMVLSSLQGEVRQMDRKSPEPTISKAAQTHNNIEIDSHC